jgi:hypothetical protein
VRLIVKKVYEKATSGDYAEFEEMRRSLLASIGEPLPAAARRACGPDCNSRDARGELLRLMAILQS